MNSRHSYVVRIGEEYLESIDDGGFPIVNGLEFASLMDEFQARMQRDHLRESSFGKSRVCVVAVGTIRMVADG